MARGWTKLLREAREDRGRVDLSAALAAIAIESVAEAAGALTAPIAGP